MPPTGGPRDVESASPLFRVVATQDSVEAWSSFRLPFQPRGEALALRTALASKISELIPGPDRIVHCMYCSADKTFVDTENVLIYNVGEGCFREVAAHGIRFERVFGEPPPSPEPLRDSGPRHYVAYRSAAPATEFTHWQRGKMIATWSDAVWPASAGTSPTPFWSAIRAAGPQTLAPSREPGRLIGLRVTVGGGEKPMRPAKMVKAVFDAGISAFHVHSKPSVMRAAVERLAARDRGDAARLEQLLTDSRFDLLGPRNLVGPYRSGASTDGVKWNPEDERCVAGELHWTPGTEDRVFSGELFEVEARDPVPAQCEDSHAAGCRVVH